MNKFKKKFGKSKYFIIYVINGYGVFFRFSSSHNNTKRHKFIVQLNTILPLKCTYYKNKLLWAAQNKF